MWLQTLLLGLHSRPTFDPNPLFAQAQHHRPCRLIQTLKNKQKALLMDIMQEPQLPKGLQFQSLSLSAWLHLPSILKELELQVQV